jgi:hypothetical protein
VRGLSSTVTEAGRTSAASERVTAAIALIQRSEINMQFLSYRRAPIPTVEIGGHIGSQQIK